MAIAKERVHRFRVRVADDGPETESANSWTYGPANERKSFCPLGLKDGKTAIAGDTEVGFEHGIVIARIGIGIQLLNSAFRPTRRGTWWQI